MTEASASVCLLLATALNQVFVIHFRSWLGIVFRHDTENIKVVAY